MTDVEMAAPPVATAGFSDAISRILSHTGVPRPKRIKREKPEDLDSKPIVPSAATDNIDQKDGDLDVKPTVKKSVARGKHLSKQERDPWHVLPEVTERDRERKLTKIATKGVVQLFNAVRAQQSDLEEKLEEAGPSFRKSEKALKSVTKGAFLDLLKNPTGSVRVIRKNQKTSDNYGEGEPAKRWEVLDDEYMTKKGAEGDSSSDEGGEGQGGQGGDVDGYDAESDSDAQEVF